MGKLPLFKNEIWKDVPSYEGLYQASDMGSVKSLNRHTDITRIRNGNKSIFKKRTKGKILKPSLGTTGYFFVNLSKNGKIKPFDIHKLVALTFMNKPSDKHEVSHKNHNKVDNRAINLQWLIRKDHKQYDGKTREVIMVDLESGIPLFFRDCSEAAKYLGIVTLHISNIRKSKKAYYSPTVGPYKGRKFFVEYNNR